VASTYRGSFQVNGLTLGFDPDFPPTCYTSLSTPRDGVLPRSWIGFLGSVVPDALVWTSGQQGAWFFLMLSTAILAFFTAHSSVIVDWFLFALAFLRGPLYHRDHTAVAIVSAFQ
jgi:hypothetical protein